MMTFVTVVNVALLSLSLIGPAFATPTTVTPLLAASVLVPGGWRDAAHVHEVPKGGKLKQVDDEIQLLDASGAVIHTAPVVRSPRQSEPKRTSSVSPTETGWIAYANWYNFQYPVSANPLNYFSANITVPPVPETWENQTLFYFNGIEPGTYDSILQPVLQYGASAAGGGEYWSTASWFVGSEVFYTSIIETTPGTELQGVMELVGLDSDGTYTYTASFTGIDTLEISGLEELAWAVITLEAYGTNLKSDFPTETTTFSGINVNTTGGIPTDPAVYWMPVSDYGDEINTFVNVNGPTNAEVAFTY